MKNKFKEITGNIYSAGVYCMKVEDEVLYIGSSIEINDALSRHLYNLKRGRYESTNKAILQEKYDLGILEFEVLHESVHSGEVRNMSAKQKEDLYKALNVLEELNINLFKPTICNKMHKVGRKSSNKNKASTFRRRKANLGERNPNCKYNEEQIQNILWFKEHTELNNREIAELFLEVQEIHINPNYIAGIGNTKWLHIEPKKSDWMDKYIA